MDSSQAEELGDILSMQKTEANAGFSKFVVKNYESWVNNKDEEKGPIMSHNLLRKKVFPVMEEGIPTVMLLLDNLRFDQWKVICLLYTSPSPRDLSTSRMPSSA